MFFPDVKFVNRYDVSSQNEASKRANKQARKQASNQANKIDAKAERKLYKIDPKSIDNRI